VNGLPTERRNAALMPQDYALFPHMTTWDNVAYGPRSKGVDPKIVARRTEELLEIVHLQQWASAYPRQLSGGMQQRVALVRALASGAKILLLDEPLGALDARLRLDLRRRLRRFARRFGLTVVHVTHDQSEAVSLGDRILLLRHGRVEQLGRPEEVYFKPRTVFAASFVGDRVMLEGQVRSAGEGLVEVELAARQRILATGAGLREGELAVVAIRCESLEIGGSRGGGVNTLRGVVKDVRPLGPHFRYVIELPGRITVRSNVPCTQSIGHSWPIGSSVDVSFSPEEAVAYRYPPRGLAVEVEAF
jgi:spermidine/putrescine transport system ATP-binding protein